MDCQKWTTLIQSDWEFLFSKYGFKMVSCIEGPHERVLLFVESSNCRIRFWSVEELNETEVDFGPIDAPLDWTPNDDFTLHTTPIKWFSLLGILFYIDNPAVTTFLPIEMRHKPNDAPPFLEMLAKQTEPHIDEISSFFSQDNFVTWRKDYEQFWNQRKSAGING